MGRLELIGPQAVEACDYVVSSNIAELNGWRLELFVCKRCSQMGNAIAKL